MPYLHFESESPSPSRRFLYGLFSTLVWFLLAALNPASARAETLLTNRWWSDSVDHAIAQAGTNSAEIAKALREAPESQREGWQFLMENMPARDLRALPAAFLLENLSLAYEAFEKAAWHDQIPKEL